MKIRKLKLYTHQLEAEKLFYASTLGLPLTSEESTHFTVQVGWTILSFEYNPIPYLYHYCFLIPCNKLTEAMEWVSKRIPVIDGKKTHRFESWNANAFYFYDASGNVVEFIVRHDLNNPDENSFDKTQILCVNEIGVPTTNVQKLNSQLENKLGTQFWKGDYERFGTNGDQHGLFLLPNFKLKETWFPTAHALKPAPFEATVEVKQKQFTVKFKNELMSISDMV